MYMKYIVIIILQVQTNCLLYNDNNVLRGSESQLKIQISCHNIADEKISNLPITNSKNNITENQDCIALHYIIIYHFTKFAVSI